MVCRVVVLVTPGLEARAERVCGPALCAHRETETEAKASVLPIARLAHVRCDPPPDVAVIVSTRFTQVIRDPMGAGVGALLLSVAERVDDDDEDAARLARASSAVRGVLIDAARRRERAKEKEKEKEEEDGAASPPPDHPAEPRRTASAWRDSHAAEGPSVFAKPFTRPKASASAARRR